MAKKRKKKVTKKETSKKLATLILIVALVDIQLCILATYFNREIPTEIAVALITEIVAVFLTYCLKAYFGKKAEEEIRMYEEHTDFDEGDIR